MRQNSFGFKIRFLRTRKISNPLEGAGPRATYPRVPSFCRRWLYNSATMDKYHRGQTSPYKVAVIYIVTVPTSLASIPRARGGVCHVLAIAGDIPFRHRPPCQQAETSASGSVAAAAAVREKRPLPATIPPLWRKLLRAQVGELGTHVQKIENERPASLPPVAIKIFFKGSFTLRAMIRKWKSQNLRNHSGRFEIFI